MVDVDKDSDGGVLHLWSAQYERCDRGVLNVVECTMMVEYRHKIESGEIKEWEIGQE